MDKYDNYIGGQWVAPVDGEYFDNTSPVDGKVFTQVARSKAVEELKADAQSVQQRNNNRETGHKIPATFSRKFYFRSKIVSGLGSLSIRKSNRNLSSEFPVALQQALEGVKNDAGALKASLEAEMQAVRSENLWDYLPDLI